MMKGILILLLFVVSVAGQYCHSAKEVRNGLTRYLLVDCAMSWRKADRFCKRKGGNLVSVQNYNENRWLGRKFTSVFGHGTHRVWIGLHTNQCGGWWKWSGHSSSFFNWKKEAGNEQPNCGRSFASRDELCVNMNTLTPHMRWTWVDANCNDRNHFICDLPSGGVGPEVESPRVEELMEDPVGYRGLESDIKDQVYIQGQSGREYIQEPEDLKEYIQEPKGDQESIQEPKGDQEYIQKPKGDQESIQEQEDPKESIQQPKGDQESIQEPKGNQEPKEDLKEFKPKDIKEYIKYIQDQRPKNPQQPEDPIVKQMIDAQKNKIPK